MTFNSPGDVALCSERHNERGAPRAKAEATEADIRAVADDFLGRFATAGFEAATSSTLFDGERCWKIVAARGMNGVPFAGDTRYLEICDRTRKVLLFADGMLSAEPPAVEASRLARAPYADPAKEVVGLPGQIAASLLIKESELTRVKFLAPKLAIVNPNRLFCGGRLGDDQGGGPARGSPTSYAWVYPMQMRLRDKHGWNCADLWIDARDGKVCGGVYYLTILVGATD